MNENNKEHNKEYNRVQYTLKDMWWACTKVAIGAFIVSGVFFQFKEVQKLQKIDHETMTNRIEYVNERIDKKHEQQTKYIEEQLKILKSDNVNQWSVINSKEDKK